MAGDSVIFKGHATDSDLVAYMQHAEALLFPGEEDFGIAPVEALATGTPVVAFGAGGALDYVIQNKTGVLFSEQTVESLKMVL